MINLRRHVRLPLLIKIITLTIALLVSVALGIAWLSSNMFEQVSLDREQSAQAAFVKAKSLEVEAFITSTIEKMIHYTADAFSGKESISFQYDADLLYLSAHHVQEGRHIRRIQTQGLKAFEKLAQDPLEAEKIFDQFIEKHKIHENKILSGETFITSSAREFPYPFILIGAPMAKEEGSVTLIAWAILKTDRLQHSFAQSLFELALIDERGQLLVHSDEKISFKEVPWKSRGVALELLKNTSSRFQQKTLPEQMTTLQTTNFKIHVLGLVSLQEVMAPATLVKESSFFILGVSVSIAFFFCVLFSGTITSNLEKLTELTKRVAAGDFEIEASQTITATDEVGVLAQSFDEMVSGLKERDKIKGIFSKFHGTEITDELMNRENLHQGQRRNVVVFFSDIRGFTEFSEGKSPEQVVTMLNEYFAIMVHIIKKHGGIVDKFVGDAIMAVWGAPQTTGDDAYQAVMACLKMREELHQLNLSRESRGLTPIKIGMGLHYGPAVAGTLGSDERLEYTVIGDTVNTASRIESSTKSFGTDLLISEEVALQLRERCLLSFAGTTEVKGKKEALKLAKVEGYIGAQGESVIIKTPWSSYEAEADSKVKGVKTA